MAFHSSETFIGHEIELNQRRAKYKAATKSCKGWYERQLELANNYEQDTIEKMSDKELARYLRSKLKSVFGK